METLFSTVAQISFTIVGLFFVAITVDPDSKDFWLGDKTLSQYVTVIFFMMLLPGLISIGWLIPFSLFSIPASLYVTGTSFFVYCYVYFDLLKFYKSSAYKQIANFETSLDAKGILKFNIIGLVVLIGASMYISFVDNSLNNSLSSAIGIYLFVLILSSVIPPYVFLRKSAESKRQKEVLNNNGSITPVNKPVDHLSSDTKGIFYLVVLLGALISFIMGRFLSKN